jgi:uncharacterized protein
VLPFLDRSAELARLRSALASEDDALVCLYGRRRLGKSRLIRELLGDGPAVYYVGDARDASVQMDALAREVGRLVPGFGAVSYPGWTELFERFWRDAPPGAPLVVDEFPSLVAVSPELPSVLQKICDRPSGRRRKTLLCGSSQRMMLGLLLDATAPLFGRAREILKIEPLEIGWLPGALPVRDAAEVVERWAFWGGVPRYWELAREHTSHAEAVRALLLDPLGVLHREPERLLLDEMADATRAASILALIGQGSHRLSEIAGRLGQPATSLARPLARLVELGFVLREVPFGESERDSKRSLYRIADPFLRSWFRFVEPNRSRLALGRLRAVEADMRSDMPAHVGQAWEEIVRRSVPRLGLGGETFGPASRYWGRDRAGAMTEIDVVSASEQNPGHLLVGEAKASCSDAEVERFAAALASRARAIPSFADRTLTVALFVGRLSRPPRQRRRPTVPAGVAVVTAEDVTKLLR